MLGYYVALARRSLKRNVGLTVLMILAIAFGVGASMTTLTVLHVLSADPIPGKSHHLHYVQLDPRPLIGYQPGGQPNEQVSRRDAENLLRDAKADRQAMMTGGNVAVEPQRADLKPFFVDSRWTSADFFPMFEVPFVAGSGWSAEDDQHMARVVVIGRALAEKLFGSVDVVGRSVRAAGNELRIVGVIDDWRPQPRFYDVWTGHYGGGELLFAPFSTSLDLKFGHSGNMNCWDEAIDNTALDAPCEWIQYWAELGTSEKLETYNDYLVHDSEEQRRVGRYQRPPNVELPDVLEWLDHKKVIPDDVRLQTWIAFGFLLVCLVNTVGLLLTKFLRRAPEIGVRRALGASKRSIFVQLLVESGMIGVVGGVLGLGLAYLGLWAVRHQPAAYAELAQLDLPMLAATFALSVVASVLAGLLPAWRGCQVTPALQLKSH
jgi:putative ABC transport system permease protein